MKLCTGVSFFVMALSFGFTCINCLNNDRETSEGPESRCLSVYWPTGIACLVTVFLQTHHGSDRNLWRRFESAPQCFTDLQTESDLNAKMALLLAAWDSTPALRSGYSLVALFMLLWGYLSQKLRNHFDQVDASTRHGPRVPQRCPIRSVELDSEAGSEMRE
jgi:hypothetical protein